MPRPQGPTAVAFAVAAVIVAVTPVATVHVGRNAGFLPAQLAIVACLDLLGLFLLGQAFLRTGDRRLLSITVAYAFAFAAMVGHALSFPGVVTPAGPLATAASVTTWLHIVWHVGFPVLLALAWLRPDAAIVEAAGRTRAVAAGLATGLGTGGLVVTAFVLAGPHLPVLVVNGNSHRLTETTAPFCVPLLAFAVLVTWRAARRATGAARWTFVTVAVAAADMTVFYAAGGRYTVGWYAGRLLTLAGAAAIVVGLLAELVRAHARLDAEMTLHRVTLDNLSEGVLHRDADGKLLLSNAAARPVPALAGIFEDDARLDLATSPPPCCSSP